MMGTVYIPYEIEDPLRWYSSSGIAVGLSYGESQALESVEAETRPLQDGFRQMAQDSLESENDIHERCMCSSRCWC